MDNLTQFIMPQQSALSMVLNKIGIAVTPNDISNLRENNFDELMERLSQLYSVNSTGWDQKNWDRITGPFVVKLDSNWFLSVISKSKKTVLLGICEDPSNVATIKLSDFKKLVATAHSIYTFEKSPQLLHAEYDITFSSGHWLYSRITKEKRILGAILALSIFANGLAAVGSLFSLQVYDRVIPNQSIETLWVLFAGLGIAIAMEMLLRLERTRLFDKLGAKIDYFASSEIFQHICLVKNTQKKHSPAYLAQLMNDFRSVREFFTEIGIGVAVDIPFAVFFLWLIYTISGPAVWVCVVGILIICIPSLMAQRLLLKQSRESSDLKIAESRLMREVAYNLDLIKGSRATSYFLNKWQDILEVSTVNTTRQRLVTGRLSQLAMSTQQLTFGVVVVVCVYLVIDSQITMGAIIATTILSSRAIQPMVRLGTVIARWHFVKVSMTHLNELVAAPKDIDPLVKKLRRPNLSGAVEISNLKFSFSTEEEQPSDVLDIQNITIQNGDKIAILGANGSGKTTLLSLISGNLHANEGAIRFDEIDSNLISVLDLRNCISFLPAEVKLIRGTLRENLTFGNQSISDDMVESELAKVGLQNLMSISHLGLDYPIQDAGLGLSTGQKQSIGLARLFLSGSGIMLLDEPTSNLDSQSENLLMSAISKLSNEYTMIIATHRPAVLNVVSRIIILDKGKVVADGPKNEVLEMLSNGKADA